MKIRFYYYVLPVCFIAGIFYWAVEQGLILFRLPINPVEFQQVQNKKTIDKKIIKLIFWHNEKWQTEETELIWSANKSQNIKYLIDSWLTLLDEEKFMENKVSLQSAQLSSSQQDVLLSFDRNPFSSQQSTHEKWLWIEGLLKTIRENGIKLQHIRFLVHHQPLQDNHLNFSHPWPLSGFLQQ